MIRNALAVMMALPGQNSLAQRPSDNAFSVYLTSSPTTHDDGSVTWNPPERYDHAFDGEETVYRLPQDQVPDACRELFKKAGLNVEVTKDQKGCAAYKGKRGYIIVMDKPFKGVSPEDAIRHERGHLNGWPADHPD